MSLSRSWQFLGGVDSRPYSAFDWVRRRLNRRLVDFLRGHLPARGTKAGGAVGPPLRVLEAGSGTAYASSLFRRHPGVKICVSLDIDRAALVEARRRDAGLSVVVGDLRRMPFVAGAFLLVFNSSTVEHVAEPGAALREMQRVCDPQGRVFVGVPYSRGPLALQPLIRNTLVGRWLGPVFSRKALHAMLSAAGLRPIASIRYFWSFFVGTVAAKGSAPASRAVEAGQ